MSILLRPVLLKVWALLYAVSLTPPPLDVSLTASSFFVGNWPPRFLVHAQWTPLPSPVETSLRPKTIKVNAFGTKLPTSIPVPQDPMKRSSLSTELSSRMACKVRLLSYTYILTCGAASFRKVLKLAPTSGCVLSQSIVEITLMSPFSPGGLETMATGSDADKAIFLSSRGLEIMTLIDEFIQGYNFPPTLGDGKTGGDALVGWSLEDIVTCAAISSAK